MTYVYEPEWESPKEELEISLNIYRRLVNRMHVYDDMEVIAYLPARDGIQWALEQLAEEVDPDILAEVEELDALSVTMDPYDNAPTLDELIPIFGRILEAKSLSIYGEMTLEQVAQLRQALPSGCLAINAVVGK